jgi:hypothetical protein
MAGRQFTRADNLPVLARFGFLEKKNRCYGSCYDLLHEYNIFRVKHGKMLQIFPCVW